MQTDTWTTGLLALAITAASCGDTTTRAGAGDGGAETGLLRVAAVNYPLAYMAERIGGDAVDVVYPVPADVDPAFWSPTPDDIAGFQQADLILRNGAGYAGWTRTATLPASRVVDTSAGFTDRLIAEHDRVTHSHGPDGEHAHGGTAFTTWLDPELAILQAAAVRDALVGLRPAHATAFQTAFTALEADWTALDARLAAAVALAADRPVVYSHPVYDYLTRRYGIAGTSLHWEPDEAPNDAQWRELEAVTAETGARWLIWEGDPSPATVAALSERGVRSAVFDPCGNRPEQGDLLDVMAANAAELERVFGSAD